MALEDQLLDDFRHLSPSARQKLLAFSRQLVKQDQEQQAEAMSEAQHQALMQALQDVRLSVPPMTEPVSNRDHDHDIYLSS